MGRGHQVLSARERRNQTEKKGEVEEEKRKKGRKRDRTGIRRNS